MQFYFRNFFLFVKTSTAREYARILYLANFHEFGHEYHEW